MKSNSHIHLPPNFSAFDDVAQAVQLAADQQLSVLGASNYYDFNVYGEFARLCGRNGIMPLFGTEIICMIDELRISGDKINDPGNPGKMYLCGKGITRFSPMNAVAAVLMDTIRKNDSVRMAEMTRLLSALFADAGLAASLSETEVKQMIADRHGSPPDTIFLQERHIAQAFQEWLFAAVSIESRTEALSRLFGTPSKCASDDAAGIQNEIRSHLMKSGKPAFVPETFVDFDHAYKLILELGGIPCYPTLADGTSPICGFEEDVDALIASIRGRMIYSCELIPVRNSPEQLTRYVTSMRQAGMIVTAGTEHNTRDVIPMAPTCVNGAPIPKQVQEVFWEGACVVAAHQYLTSAGKPGYVDGAGRLAGNYPDTDARIAELQRLGAEVIHRAADKISAMVS